MGFPLVELHTSMIKPLVWYIKDHDEIAIIPYLDALFYGLNNKIDWDRVELLGPL